MDAYERLRKYPLNVVLATLGFENWKWRKSGTEGYGKCPICLPKRNTTAFSFDDDGKWHCFACNAKGRGSLDLVMAVKQCGFKDAVSFLEGITGTIPTEPTKKPAKEETPAVTENKPYEGKYEKFYIPSEWLAARGLTKETLDRYGVGQYSNPARKSGYSGMVMLPILRFVDGAKVGYLARNITEVTPEKPKYRVPAGLQKQLELWGAVQLKDQAPIRVLYVVESAFSAMHFYQLGFPCVALLGWSVSPQQLDIIARLAKGVCYLPDSDKRKEAQTYAGLLATKLWVKFPEMPVSDPELLSAEMIRALA